MTNLPIDPEILKKRNDIPELIAKLSYINEIKALDYLRLWGERRIPITKMHERLLAELNESEKNRD